MAVTKRCWRSTANRAKQQSNRPRKLCQWSETAMSKALDLVVEGKMGINRAALECGVPRTTLKGRITGKVAPGCRKSKKAYLTEEEEKELVTYSVCD